MIVTSLEEIRAYVPTSVYKSDTSLLTLIKASEETHLIPILGRSLYDHVNQRYAELTQDGTSAILPNNQPGDTANDTPEVQLIRICQQAAIYFTLADNTGLLSVSLNGGGINQVGTQGYDVADKDALNRFSQDAFHKARRSIDLLLQFLENDAQKEIPLFAGLWRESRYFYLQGDLLFTTAIEMQRFLNIGADREKFIALLPDIRYFQDNHIAPRVGEELLEELIRSITDAEAVNEALPEEDAAQISLARKHWRRAIDLLRQALARLVQSKGEEKQRMYHENQAILALNRAAGYIAAHQDAFGNAIKDSPLYVKPAEETSPNESPIPSDAEPLFDYEDPDNALFVFGRGKGMNRH